MCTRALNHCARCAAVSADTAYKRVGNRKLGGTSKKKLRQRATRERNIEKASEEDLAGTDVAMREGAEDRMAD